MNSSRKTGRYWVLINGGDGRLGYKEPKSIQTPVVLPIVLFGKSFREVATYTIAARSGTIFLVLEEILNFEAYE